MPATRRCRPLLAGAPRVARLEPGATVEHRFGADETAVLVNRGERTARLLVQIRGDTSLSMGYSSPDDP